MIRKAKAEEIDKLLKITRACAAKMIEENIYQWNETYPNKAAFKQDISKGELYVLDQNGEIIACIAICNEKDTVYNDVKWLTPDANNLYIHRLAVHPDHQKKGYAKKLMDFAEDFARKQVAVSIRLDTFSKNPRNQKFYLNRGYRQLGSVYFPRQSEFPFYCFELVLNA